MYVSWGSVFVHILVLRVFPQFPGFPPFSKSSLIPNCVGPEKIHTHPIEGHLKFLREGGSYKPKFYKKSMKLYWNFFSRGRGAKQKNLLWGEYGYFLELHILISSRIAVGYRFVSIKTLNSFHLWFDFNNFIPCWRQLPPPQHLHRSRGCGLWHGLAVAVIHQAYLHIYDKNYHLTDDVTFKR